MLSKDAKIVLYNLYKEYLVRRNNGSSRSYAKNFGSSSTIHADLFPDWLIEDLDDVLRELGRNHFLHNLYASNTIYQCELTDFAITKMENQRKETFLSIADFVSKFIP